MNVGGRRVVGALVLCMRLSIYILCVCVLLSFACLRPVINFLSWLFWSVADGCYLVRKSAQVSGGGGATGGTVLKTGMMIRLRGGKGTSGERRSTCERQDQHIWGRARGCVCVCMRIARGTLIPFNVHCACVCVCVCACPRAY
jgi:hypothetical protein